MAMAQERTGAWRATFSGLCATLVGVGLARFAYTPLIPALVEAGWFTASQAAYLGAANLAGYLAGALLAAPMARWLPVPVILRGMMTLAAVTFFTSAAPLPFLWFFVWRFASGLSGGTLMVLGTSTVLRTVGAARRGLAAGILFTGVGLGIAASGTLVPLLLQWGLTATWCGLGAFALLLTFVAWAGWPADAAKAATNEAETAGSIVTHRPNLLLRALYVEYALSAIGFVPHMVFLVDFIARGLAQGVVTGALYWVIFGVGAMIGPMLAGQIADRVGFRPALRMALLIQMMAVGCLVITHSAIALLASSFVVGALVPGIVPLVAGRLHELVRDDPASQRSAWGLATTAFALGQAAGAYALSYIFDATGSAYVVLFAVGAAALIPALTLDLVSARVARRTVPS